MEQENRSETSTHAAQLAITKANREIQLFEDYKELVEEDKFINVIIKGFLTAYVTELTDEMMDGILEGKQSTASEMETKIRKIEGIGSLPEYVTRLHNKAQMAVERIKREQEFLAKQGE